MSTMKLYKLLTLPQVLEPNALYFIKDGQTGLVLHATDSTGSATWRTPLISELPQASPTTMDLITAISTYDELGDVDINKHRMVLVADATGDPTVGGGAATYVYSTSTNSWVKIAEHESMDINLTWGSILDKPSSTVAAIDTAVANSHTHANKSLLDSLSVQDGAIKSGETVLAANLFITTSEW